MGKDWFEKLFGFVEAEGDVQSLLRVEGDRLVSAVNGASFGIGSFACPSCVHHASNDSIDLEFR